MATLHSAEHSIVDCMTLYQKDHKKMLYIEVIHLLFNVQMHLVAPFSCSLNWENEEISSVYHNSSPDN